VVLDPIQQVVANQAVAVVNQAVELSFAEEAEAHQEAEEAERYTLLLLQ
jgi:hypothetical protein